MLNLEEYWEGIRPISGDSPPAAALAPLVDWAERVCVDPRCPKVYALRGANRHQVLNDWLRREGVMDEPGVGVDFNGRAASSLLNAWCNTWVPPEVCRKLLSTTQVNMMVGFTRVPDLRRPDGISGFGPTKVFRDLVQIRSARWLSTRETPPNVAHMVSEWKDLLGETQPVATLAVLAAHNGLMTKAILTIDSNVEVAENDWMHVPVAFLTI